MLPYKNKLSWLHSKKSSFVAQEKEEAAHGMILD